MNLISLNTMIFFNVLYIKVAEAALRMRLLFLFHLFLQKDETVYLEVQLFAGNNKWHQCHNRQVLWLFMASPNRFFKS